MQASHVLLATEVVHSKDNRWRFYKQSLQPLQLIVLRQQGHQFHDALLNPLFHLLRREHSSALRHMDFLVDGAAACPGTIINKGARHMLSTIATAAI